MEAFLVPTLSIALAEIGDKTQMLAFLLAARYRRPAVLCLALAAATLTNNALGGVMAYALSLFVRADALPWMLCVCLIGLAAWSLTAEKYVEKANKKAGRGVLLGVFGTAFAAFFLAGLGGKAQVATAVLTLHSQAMLPTVAGASLGVLLTHLPALIVGQRLAGRLPADAAHWAAAAIYAVLAYLAVNKGGLKVWFLSDAGISSWLI